MCMYKCIQVNLVMHGATSNIQAKPNDHASRQKCTAALVMNGDIKHVYQAKWYTTAPMYAAIFTSYDSQHTSCQLQVAQTDNNYYYHVGTHHFL